ncbi:MAG TPA: FliH/SctL family protein [Phycisphaerales bacterium]|nr:FliH/SctL family protein [Phycisphaerales bacterium]
MALIKHANAGMIAREAIVLDLGDLRRQGEEIVRQARVEGARIVAAAREERVRVLAGAREEGFAAGREQGVAQGRAEGREEAIKATLVEHRERLAKIESAWLAAVGDFEARREDLVQGAMRDVVRLAVGIAERIVKRSVSLDPSVVADQVGAALAVVVRPTEVVVRINPEDRAVVTAALPRLMGAMPAVKHAEIVEDAGVERGGCVVGTKVDSAGTDAGGWGGGEIDARLGVQLDRIVETLLPGEKQTA